MSLSCRKDPGCLKQCLYASLLPLPSHCSQSRGSRDERTGIFNDHAKERARCVRRFRDQRTGSLWSGNTPGASAEERASLLQRPAPAPHPTWLEVSRSEATAVRAAPGLWRVCSRPRNPLCPAAMISASRSAAARLVGTAASRRPAAARHQVRNCHAFRWGLQARSPVRQALPFGVRL